jgi:hypothetical protein
MGRWPGATRDDVKDVLTGLPYVGKSDDGGAG